ncbi:MAG: hypothetical protein ABR529_09745 [Actinomycetota bacterium]
MRQALTHPALVRAVGRLLRRTWAAPASLLGLLLAPFFGRRSVRDGVLLCEGAGWPRRLGFRYRAMTLGHVVLCIDEVDDALLGHELVHVRQHEMLGPLFLPSYALASLVAVARGGDAYSDNAFEVAARREPSSRARS